VPRDKERESEEPPCYRSDDCLPSRSDDCLPSRSLFPRGRWGYCSPKTCDTTTTTTTTTTTETTETTETERVRDGSLYGGSSFVKLSWSGIADPQPQDWIAAYCPATGDSNDYIDWFYIGDTGDSRGRNVPGWESGRGSTTFRLYNMRCEYQFFYLRNNGHNQAAATGSISFNGPRMLHTHIALTEQESEISFQWNSDLPGGGGPAPLLHPSTPSIPPSTPSTPPPNPLPLHPTLYPSTQPFTRNPQHSSPSPPPPGSHPPFVRAGTSSGLYTLQSVGGGASSTTYANTDMCDAPATDVGAQMFRDVGFFHEATLRDLAPSTRYYYQVCQQGGSSCSDEADFTTPPVPGPNNNIKFTAWGDMGPGGNAGTCDTVLGYNPNPKP
jgi:hypothetical protein